MNKDRLKKLESNLYEIVSYSLLILTRDLQEKYWIITINEIKLSTEWRYLDIFISCTNNIDNLCKSLAKFSNEIKQEINKNMFLRIMPIIRFRYTNELKDTSNLINKINNLKL